MLESEHVTSLSMDLLIVFKQKALMNLHYGELNDRIKELYLIIYMLLD